MQRAQAEDQIDAVDADNLAVGEELGQGVERNAIGGVVERGNQNEAVGDVEVGVAGGQALAIEEDGGGHGQGHDAERLAVLIAGRLKPQQIVVQRLVVQVISSRLDHGHHGLRTDEPGEVVHMSVRVVAGDAIAEPDDVPGTRKSASTRSIPARSRPGLRH